jgi:nucleoid-associated protein YgaU
MGIFDRKDDDKNLPKPVPKADFSNVQGGSSSTAPAPARPAPVPTSAGTSGTTAGHSYTVVAGDSLSKIAKREYGDANSWNRIYEANRDIIKDPDLIYPGQTLKIPAKA